MYSSNQTNIPPPKTVMYNNSKHQKITVGSKINVTPTESDLLLKYLERPILNEIAATLIADTIHRLPDRDQKISSLKELRTLIPSDSPVGEFIGCTLEWADYYGRQSF